MPMGEARMHPGAVWPLTEEDYAQLDPGIRELVRFLVGHRFRTTDSGDGISKLVDFSDEALDIPHISIALDPVPSAMASADRLLQLLKGRGVAMHPGMIQMTYDPVDESCLLMLVGVNSAMCGLTPKRGK